MIKYVNSAGKSLRLDGDGIFVNPTEMLGWEYEVDETSGRVTNFRKETVTKSVPAVVYGGFKRMNDLYELTAVDVIKGNPGALWFGDYYMSCFMTASEVDNWWGMDGKATHELQFTTSDPWWYRDIAFTVTERHDRSDAGLDYPYDYPYDFGAAPTAITINNDSFTDADLLIRMFGPLNIASVEIGDNSYTVGISLGPEEYLEIDTQQKTVTRIKPSGERTNEFSRIAGDYRIGSGSYIFEMIKPGVNEVTWSGAFDFDVIVKDRRDQPRWRKWS